MLSRELSVTHNHKVLLPHDRSVEARQAERDLIEQQVQAFLASGGTITMIPAGVTGIDYEHRTLHDMSELTYRRRMEQLNANS